MRGPGSPLEISWMRKAIYTFMLKIGPRMPTLSPYPGCRDRSRRRAQGLRLIRGWIKRSNPHPRIACALEPYCGTRSSDLICRNTSDPSLALFWCHRKECQDRLIRVRMMSE